MGRRDSRRRAPGADLIELSFVEEEECIDGGVTRDAMVTERKDQRRKYYERIDL